MTIPWTLLEGRGRAILDQSRLNLRERVITDTGVKILGRVWVTSRPNWLFFFHPKQWRRKRPKSWAFVSDPVDRVCMGAGMSVWQALLLTGSGKLHPFLSSRISLVEGQVTYFSAWYESHGIKPSSSYKGRSLWAMDSPLPSDQHFSQQLRTSWAI